MMGPPPGAEDFMAQMGGMGFGRGARPPPALQIDESQLSWPEFIKHRATKIWKGGLNKAVEKSLFYGWIPVVMYLGLDLGTHKFVKEGKMMPEERLARWTDIIPIFGTAGLP